jgi:cysteine-rich repeat protein
MRLETPILVVRRRAVALLWASLVLPLASCLELGSRSCSEDLTCPADMKCSADRSACIATPCGNGVQELDEQCDDGNLRDGDGCSHDCRSTEACGNNTLDRGEACDDGNTLSGDGCSADCRSKEVCGNGIADLAAGELCDDGNKKDGDGCSADCHSAERCGNDVVDFAVGEVCDDGNTAAGDGCSSDCRSGEGCGNHVIDVDKNEECDDGNHDNNDDCLDRDGQCVLARCGDGVTNSKGRHVEECDDKGESALCNLNCTLRHCGDGIVNRAAGEQCDTGGESSTCNADCTLAHCGDRIVNQKAGEDCDDGNLSNADDCLNNCKYSASCGDGVRQDWEACDDGNRDACGTCGGSCQEYQLTRATGTITAVASTSIRDGATFSLSDGASSRKVFEFDKDDDVDSGNIGIGIKNLDAKGVARAIRVAINNEPGLSIYVDWADSATVKLTNGTENPRAGSFGNQRITETVGHKDFKVEGMAGGGAGDCPAGTHCQNGEDCASGFCDPASGWICK